MSCTIRHAGSYEPAQIVQIRTTLHHRSTVVQLRPEGSISTLNLSVDRLDLQYLSSSIIYSSQNISLTTLLVLERVVAIFQLTEVGVSCPSKEGTHLIR